MVVVLDIACCCCCCCCCCCSAELVHTIWRLTSFQTGLTAAQINKSNARRPADKSHRLPSAGNLPLPARVSPGSRPPSLSGKRSAGPAVYRPDIFAIRSGGRITSNGRRKHVVATSPAAPRWAQRYCSSAAVYSNCAELRFNLGR